MKSKVYLRNPRFPYEIQGLPTNSKVCLQNPRFPYKIEGLPTKSKVYLRNPRFTYDIQGFPTKSKVYLQNPRFAYEIQGLHTSGALVAFAPMASKPRQGAKMLVAVPTYAIVLNSYSRHGAKPERGDCYQQKKLQILNPISLSRLHPCRSALFLGKKSSGHLLYP